MVWLKASPKSLIDRAARNNELRPTSLGRQAQLELTTILESREPLYAKADAEIMTSDKPTEQVLAELLQLMSEHEAKSQES